VTLQPERSDAVAHRGRGIGHFYTAGDTAAYPFHMKTVTHGNCKGQ
jgi:hypothetical protein